MKSFVMTLVNPCTNNPCQNGGVCTVNGDDSYSCKCADGYYGQTCEKGTSTINMIVLDFFLQIEAINLLTIMDYYSANHNVSFPQ